MSSCCKPCACLDGRLPAQNRKYRLKSDKYGLSKICHVSVYLQSIVGTWYSTVNTVHALIKPSKNHYLACFFIVSIVALIKQSKSEKRHKTICTTHKTTLFIDSWFMCFSLFSGGNKSTFSQSVLFLLCRLSWSCWVFAHIQYVVVVLASCIKQVYLGYAVGLYR